MEGDKIIMLGDFNKNVYSGRIADLMAGDDLNLHEVCQRTTWQYLPPTHARGQVPIDAVFGLAGVRCVGVTLLPG